MAEGVQTALGIAHRAVCGGEDHSRGSDGSRDRSRHQDAHAHGSSALIARACDHRRSRVKAEAGGTRRPPTCAHTSEDSNSSGSHDSGIPATLATVEDQLAMCHIQQECSGSFLHVHRESSGHPVANVILGAENMRESARRPPVHCSFTHSSLVRVKVRQRRIAGELDEVLSAQLLRAASRIARRCADRTR